MRGRRRLYAAAKAGQCGEAEGVLQEMAAAGLEPGPRAFHALVVAYAKTGDADRALEAVQRGYTALRDTGAPSGLGAAPAAPAVLCCGARGQPCEARGCGAAAPPAAQAPAWAQRERPKACTAAARAHGSTGRTAALAARLLRWKRCRQISAPALPACSAAWQPCPRTLHTVRVSPLPLLAARWCARRRPRQVCGTLRSNPHPGHGSLAARAAPQSRALP